MVKRKLLTSAKRLLLVQPRLLLEEYTCFVSDSEAILNLDKVCFEVKNLCFLLINCFSYLALGNVQHVDLTGHIWDYKPEHVSLCTEFVHNESPILVLPSSSTSAAPHDHDP